MSDGRPPSKKPTLAERASEDPSVVTQLMFRRISKYVDSYERVEELNADDETCTLEGELAGVRFYVHVGVAS